MKQIYRITNIYSTKIHSLKGRFGRAYIKHMKYQ